MPLPVIVNPVVGWAVIGTAGFVTYKLGKRSGLKGVDAPDRPGLKDRALKGAMKTVYRARKGMGEAFGKSREKYGAMWAEARDEVKAAK